MMKVRKTLCVILSLAIILALAACGKTSNGDTSPSGNSQQPAERDWVSHTIALPGALGIFLLGISPQENRSACSIVFDSVFYCSVETQQPYSYILSDWGFEDPLTFVMTLKSGITFSNGHEATPSDLLYSYRANQDRGSLWFRGVPIDWDNSKVRPDGKVELKMLEPYPIITDVLVYLLDEAWCREVGEDSMDWYKPVASGPYYVHEYVTDSYMVLRLRDSADYWNSANTNFVVDEWVIKFYPDETSLYMDFEQGNIDLARISTQSYERFLVEGGDNFDVHVFSSGVVQSFFLDNAANELFNDIAVRKAIAHACDWPQLGRASMGSAYQPANSFTVPGTRWNNPSVSIYEYDPDLARQTLADAGYSDGDVVFNVYVMQHHAPFYEAMQYYLQEVGIVMNVEYGDQSSALAKWVVLGGTEAGRAQNGNGSISRNPRASLDHYTGSGIVFTTWHDENLQRMIKAAYAETDQDKQQQMYWDLQEFMHNNYIAFPVANFTQTVAYRTDIFKPADINNYIYEQSYFDLLMLSQLALK